MNLTKICGSQRKEATMAKTEQMNGHGECSHCHYGNYPKATNPCRDCRWNTEMHPDRWQPKEGGRHDKPYNVQ